MGVVYQDVNSQAALLVNRDADDDALVMVSDSLLPYLVFGLSIQLCAPAFSTAATATTVAATAASASAPQSAEYSLTKPVLVNAFNRVVINRCRCNSFLVLRPLSISIIFPYNSLGGTRFFHLTFF